MAEDLCFEDSEAYERFMGRWTRAVGALFVDWAACPEQAHWLDVGCGTGGFTELILDRCAPQSVTAIDPSPAQIAHACREPVGRRATFRVADAQSLPFADASFDVVASALVINFIPDPQRGLAEMARVARPGGVLAAYVWDFEADASPSWPMRAGMRRAGLPVVDAPGQAESGIPALTALFGGAGLDDIATTTFEVTVPFADFDDFWASQTPSYSPNTRTIAALTDAGRARLKEAVRAALPPTSGTAIAYAARANAIRARMPG